MLPSSKKSERLTTGVRPIQDKHNIRVTIPHARKEKIMKEVIRDMLNKAYEEKDLDLANIANDLMKKLASTHNCPTNWRTILEELYEENKGNEWIVNAVYEFSLMKE